MCISTLFQNSCSLHRAKWIKVHGTTYKKPSAVLITFENDSSKFGELQEAVCVQGEVYLHLQVRETLFYSSHHHAYVVGKKKGYVTLHVGTLLSHIPLHLRCVKGLTQTGGKAVILKHNNISTLLNLFFVSAIHVCFRQSVYVTCTISIH